MMTGQGSVTSAVDAMKIGARLHPEVVQLTATVGAGARWMRGLRPTTSGSVRLSDCNESARPLLDSDTVLVAVPRWSKPGPRGGVYVSNVGRPAPGGGPRSGRRPATTQVAGSSADLPWVGRMLPKAGALGLAAPMPVVDGRLIDAAVPRVHAAAPHAPVRSRAQRVRDSRDGARGLDAAGGGATMTCAPAPRRTIQEPPATSPCTRSRAAADGLTSRARSRAAADARGVSCGPGTANVSKPGT